MFTAWLVVLWSYHYDIIKNGFDSNAFSVMVCVALGSKITDAISKKINPDGTTTVTQTDTNNKSSTQTIVDDTIVRQ